MRQFQITSQDRAFTFLFQGKNDTVTTMQFEYYTLQVQKNVDDILPNTVKSGILMQNASNSNFGRCVTRHRREQDPAQGVTQSMGITTLERLHRHTGVCSRNRLHIDQTRFQKFRSAVLHSHSLRASDYLE
ncbi:hypothetical protein D3C72_2126910 [compost metagenome]